MTKFEYNGVIYLRDVNNVVYDMDTQDEVGTWDEEQGKIMPMVENEDE